ncbi:MAG: glycosyltransferase [Actinobacteria bacterium]|nr:glycosyltransferase [Actinomycetota bacterium]
MLPENQKDKNYKLIRNVSFISTVFNEEKSINSFLKSFFEQKYLPEEIIFVDGGSTDKTIEIIRDFFLRRINNDLGFKTIETGKKDDFKLKNVKGIELIGSYEVLKSKAANEDDIRLSVVLLQKIKANISEGRNIAIDCSENEIICASDAGCILDRNWVYEITKFEIPVKDEEDNHKQYNIVGGYNHPVALSFSEKILAMCIMPRLKEIKPDKFMPSSRNISFKKSAWEKAGGYPESLDYGEDMKFNFNLRKAGYNIGFNPDAIVYWRMRENIILIFKQFFRYSKGDARAGMYLYRHIIRFFSFFCFAAVLAVSIIFSPWFLLIYLPLFAGYVYKPFSRLNYTFKHEKNNFYRFFKKTAAIIAAPIMHIYIDMAKMTGYIYGIVKK